MTDRKFRKVKIKHGYLGFTVYFAVLCLIYKDKGYYLDFSDNKKEDVIWEILETLQGKFQPTADTIEEVIDDLVACELFSDDQFKLQTITSKRIQETYYRATVERKAIDINFDIWLLTEKEMTDLSRVSSILRSFLNRAIEKPNPPIDNTNLPIDKQSKVKESKVKESKGKESNDSKYEEIINQYHNILPELPKMIKITPKRKTLLNSLLKDFDEKTMIEVFQMAKESDFLTGKIDSSKWKASFDWILNPNNFVKILEGNYKNNPPNKPTQPKPTQEVKENVFKNLKVY